MFRLLGRMKKRELVMALIGAVLVLGQVYFDLKLPDYMSTLTKYLQTPGSELKDIMLTGLEMLACTTASFLISVVCGYLFARSASGFGYSLRESLFNHVIDCDRENMLGFSVPSLITRTTDDVNQVQIMMAMGLQLVIKAPVTAIWAVFKILGKSTELSLVTAGFVVLIIAVVLFILSLVLPKFRIVQKLTDKINAVTRENLTGLNVVHAFNAEDYQNAKFDEANVAKTKVQLFNQRWFAVLMPFISLAMNCLSLCIFWIGAAIVNKINPADFTLKLETFANIVVFSTYALYVVTSFMMLIMIFMFMPQAQVSAERINAVLDSESKIKQGDSTETEEVGSVEFKGVNFRYPGANEYDLENVSFKIEKGQTLAVIGATGSGKTTLVSLIARFYDATDGEVLVDGVNVKELTFDALYDKLGYITQKPVLFAGTISDNVAFGECAYEIEDKDVDTAIELSQSKEFVDKRDGGKNFLVAQAGKNVSGGQKQRLSIARAIARKPEILIFDDSFSALDYKTDAKLRKELAENLGDATKIIVAQRISTIRHADKILVLDEGKSVGIGTHDQLMKSCPIYKEIALSQLSEAELSGGEN